jgi:hypothetical protein
MWDQKSAEKMSSGGGRIVPHMFNNDAASVAAVPYSSMQSADGVSHMADEQMKKADFQKIAAEIEANLGALQQGTVLQPFVIIKSVKSFPPSGRTYGLVFRP